MLSNDVMLQMTTKKQKPSICCSAFQPCNGKQNFSVLIQHEFWIPNLTYGSVRIHLTQSGTNLRSIMITAA